MNSPRQEIVDGHRHIEAHEIGQQRDGSAVLSHTRVREEDLGLEAQTRLPLEREDFHHVEARPASRDQGPALAGGEAQDSALQTDDVPMWVPL